MLLKLLLCFALSAMLVFASGRSLADPKKDDQLFHFAQRQEESLVLKVVNSDVFILEDGRRVKLIGVESAGLPPRPVIERDKEGRIIEQMEDTAIPLEEQAVSYAQHLAEGKKVKLESDVDALSPDGQQLAYVFLSDGRMANVELLRQGFVYLKIRPPNIKYADKLRSAYQEARREQCGFLAN